MSVVSETSACPQSKLMLSNGSFMPGQRLWKESKIESYILYWKILYPFILSKWLKKNSIREIIIYFEILMHLPSTQNENEARRSLNAILIFSSTFLCTKCMIYIYMTWINNMANFLSGVRVTRSSVLYVCVVDSCLSVCTFSFGHCFVCSSSIYGFWLPLCYLQTLLDPQCKIMHVSTIEQIF